MKSLKEEHLIRSIQTGDLQIDLLSNEDIEIIKDARISTRGAIIVSDGDSWFDYLPGMDIIDCLRVKFSYDTRNFAHAGDTLENMLMGSNYNSEGINIGPRIRRSIREVGRVRPTAFLFSGGGNDIAGNYFSNYINHASSGIISPFRYEIAHYMINTVFRNYIIGLLEMVRLQSISTTTIMHGYAYPYPSGKGVGVFGFNFVGPWLLPAIQRKAVSEETGAEILIKMVDMYYDMLISIRDEGKYNFHVIDIRNLIQRSDWRDEMHLNNSAYMKVAAIFDEKIKNLHKK